MKLLGTHRGELEGLTPTGRFVVVHAVLYAELDPERIRLWRARVFLDAYGAAVQLGRPARPRHARRARAAHAARLRAALARLTEDERELRIHAEPSFLRAGGMREGW